MKDEFWQEVPDWPDIEPFDWINSCLLAGIIGTLFDLLSLLIISDLISNLF
jgi:hypothetical protein